MLDTNEAAQRVRARAEVLGSVVRRRRWTAVEKGRIVAEAVAPGAVIAEVARRNDMTPQHLSNWIKAAKAGRIALPGSEYPAFVPVVACEKSRAGELAGTHCIEVVVGPVVLRVSRGADAHLLELCVRAVRGALS